MLDDSSRGTHNTGGPVETVSTNPKGEISAKEEIMTLFRLYQLLSSALFLAVTGCLPAVTGRLPTGGAEPSKPLNLLILQTDEHNFRTLGCYRETLSPEQALMWGRAVVETPNIDWIARNGAICTSFYATSPVCSPSRAAFVSGRYPQNTGVVTNNMPLNDDIITFAEILRRRGYVTGYAGKWHLDGVGKPQWAPKRRFGFEDNRFMFNRGHWKVLEDIPTGPRVAARTAAGSPSYGIEGANEKNFATDFLADRAIDFIRAHRGKPFCYTVSFPDPHGPDRVRTPYDTMFQQQVYQKPRTYDVRNAEIPSWGKTGRGGYGMASYYGMVKCIDDNVGKILRALRESGILDRTMIVFTSDHGDLRGEHHRQNKGVPDEASARIPFVVYCPGKIRPGTVIHEALSNVDFLPTTLSLLGYETAGQEEGRDASDLFTTGRAPAGWRDIAFLRQAGLGPEGWLTVVTDRYKLVYSPRDMPWLFDLEKDPDERTNFLPKPEYRATVRDLSKALLEYGNRYKDPYIKAPRIQADLEWAIHGPNAYTQRN